MDAETITCTIYLYEKKEYKKEDGGQLSLSGTHAGFLVVASPWLEQDSGIASVAPLTEDAQKLSRDTFISENGGPERALSEAITSIKSAYANTRLSVQTDCPTV